MVLLYITVLLAAALFAVLLPGSDAQGARRNGLDGGQLSPAEPGSPKLRRRNETNCDPDFRSFDGTCTNNIHKTAGSASTAQFSYFDDISSVNPTCLDLPSPRMISNIVCSQSSNVLNNRKLSEFVVFFAQFLDHTIVASTADSSKPLNIEIPSTDPIFGNFSNGELPFKRNVRGLVVPFFDDDPVTDNELPINILSSAIDLASVYGASATRANDLRAGDGLMKTSANGMLPLNTDGLFNAPSSSADFFVAGDHRSNEHPVLTAFHTLFLREHNLLATELKAAFPSWGSDTLFENARKINIAQFQKIVYEEFFQVMTGRPIRAYKGFRSNVIPAVSVVFSTAAYRIGHTMVGNVISRRGKGMSSLPSINMEEMFFRRSSEFLKTGVEAFIRGAIFQRAQEIDTLVVNALRNFLFTNVPEETGFDLIAFNLQRGRDHALPKYNDLRRKFTATTARTFSDISSDPNVQSRLATAYGTVNNVEAWIGLMAEDHIPGGSMGPTLFAIWTTELGRLRDGDRFFYLTKDYFSSEIMSSFPRLQQIYTEKNTMAQIILRNSEITASEIGVSVWTSQN